MHALILDLIPAPGSLVRVIGTAERRGWVPVGLSMTPTGDTAQMRLEVSGTQSVERLVRQLRRLCDVSSVRIVGTDAQAVPGRAK
jgi:acetolactate synthase II small subunit